MKQILVIQEAKHIIGVASTVEKSFEMIKEYFGETYEIVNLRYIEDSGLEYDCEAYTKEDGGSYYPITVYYFTVDDL